MTKACHISFRQFDQVEDWLCMYVCVCVCVCMFVNLEEKRKKITSITKMFPHYASIISS